MDYVKLWTTFHDDPSVQNLSARAIVYYVNALSWAGRHETGGVFVPVGKVPAAARELIAAGKFEARDDGGPGWRIHGWSERQVDMDELREARRAAGRRGGVRSGEARRSKAEASASLGPEANGKQVLPKQTKQNEAEVEEELEVEVEKNQLQTQVQHLAPRERDALFETVAEVCGIDWHELTPTARGALNKAVAQLRGIAAEPQDVRTRAANWPYDVPLTPPGLAKHWPSLAQPRATLKPSTVRQLSRADRLEAEGL